MTDAEWEAWEASRAAAEATRIDLIRIRGYALGCCRVAKDSSKPVRLAIQALDRAQSPDEARKARRRLARAVYRCNRLCEWAERVGTFAARAMNGDIEPATQAEFAAALEELVG